MSDGSTEILLKKLVEGQDNLNKKFEKLIVIESARSEREKNQNEINQEFKEFISVNTEPLKRVRIQQGHIDKAIGGVWSKVFLALAIFVGASAFGFKWMG